MICVDPLTGVVPNRRWRWSQSCHLFESDFDLEALHEFAAKIGLKRSWFQGKSTLPHYDLTASKRKLAVKAGAKEVSRYFMIGIRKKYMTVGGHLR